MRVLKLDLVTLNPAKMRFHIYCSNLRRWSKKCGKILPHRELRMQWFCSLASCVYSGDKVNFTCPHMLQKMLFNMVL